MAVAVLDCLIRSNARPLAVPHRVRDPRSVHEDIDNVLGRPGAAGYRPRLPRDEPTAESTVWQMEVKRQATERGTEAESTKTTLRLEALPSGPVSQVRLDVPFPDGGAFLMRPDRVEAVVTTSTERGSLRAVLTPTTCRDSMANAAYGYTATVARERPAPPVEFKGCGFLATAALPLSA